LIFLLDGTVCTFLHSTLQRVLNRVYLYEESRNIIETNAAGKQCSPVLKMENSKGVRALHPSEITTAHDGDTLFLTFPHNDSVGEMENAMHPCPSRRMGKNFIAANIISYVFTCLCFLKLWTTGTAISFSIWLVRAWYSCTSRLREPTAVRVFAGSKRILTVGGGYYR
jgi:hypothetical protein